MKRLDEVIKGNSENYILPFLWLHGEEESILRETVRKIEESGIRAFCIEARPHPDFLKENWWRDIDILLDEAKKRNMNIWILDDSHFPTGYANGRVKEEFPHLRKQFLTCKVLDFIGPMKHAQAILRYAYRSEKDKLVAVIMGKKTGYEKVDSATLVDITKQVVNNTLVSFELPAGEWSIMIVTATYQGGEKETEGYLNPIDPAATDILIDTVYEAHYKKYKNEFGKTISGFFSDEPRFGNMHGCGGSIGRIDMDLPWKDNLEKELSKVYGEDCRKYLPLLFIDGAEEGHQIRYAYMNLVSELYSRHFNKRIADWCSNHGVEYIGHTIEDNNAHARLGYGAGHFFRAMAHQDMSGIDVVLHQLLPGMDSGAFKSKTKDGWDGEFFHYVLGKLGSSLAHQNPNMQGRAMCEVFGAYGWAEGNRLMKWIADYMLVRGINYFVPHAFDPKEYPDADCPPHFYAHGRDPQFEGFRILMDYINRLSHLLNGGIHRAPLGLLYHGEAEWSGDYMLMQKPARELTRNQIDFDILPIDSLLNAKVNQSDFQINKESFQGLVIPYAQALPAEFMKKLLEFTEQKIYLYWMNGLPERSSEGKDISDIITCLQNSEFSKIVSEEELVKVIKRDELSEITVSTYEPYLRYYHYEQEDGDIYFFVNEHPYNTVNTNIILPNERKCLVYDPMENTYEEEENPFELTLSPYESKVFVFSKTMEKTLVKGRKLRKLEEYSLTGPYQVSFAGYPDFKHFENTRVLKELKPLQEIKGLENFVGVVRYEIEAQVNRTKITKLKLEGVSEGAALWVNGKLIGKKICSPYEFDITRGLKDGTNQFTIEVSNTLVRERYDLLSQFMLVEPIGITGNILIQNYDVEEKENG